MNKIPDFICCQSIYLNIFKIFKSNWASETMRLSGEFKLITLIFIDSSFMCCRYQVRQKIIICSCLRSENRKAVLPIF